MDSAVFSLYRVEIRDLVKNRLYITKYSGIQPDVYESWPFYEYEFLLEDIKEYIEEENKRNSDESQQSPMNDMRSSINSSLKTMMSDVKSSMKSMKTSKID